MRIVIGAILVVLAALVVVVVATGDGAGNGGRDAATTHPRSAVAAFYPLAFAAEQIGGDSLAVENLTPPGAEPHDLEVTPRDVEDLRTADLVLLMGVGFQPQLESAAGERSGVLRLLETPGLDLAPGDPHIWLDPVRFAAVADVIGEALGGRRAADVFKGRLSSLDGEFRRGLADCMRREIVTAHEAFGYLAQRYGLEQVSISGISPEAEPTPKDLENAADAVSATGATTVFTETLVSPELSRAVARETGARTAVLDPVEGLTPDEQADGGDYFSVMRKNLAALRSALDCR